MGAKPHICSGPECPCYQCSACKRRWILKAKIKKHQSFDQCKNKLTPSQVLIDHRLEAATPARVQLPPVPVPVPDAAPAPELQQEDPPQARSQDGQHGKRDCCTLQVHCRCISTQYKRHSFMHCRYIPGISLHITRGS